MTAEHLVSVLIPAQNHSGTFELALKSALAQTYSHVEIIVIADSTDDTTPKFIAPYLEQYKTIQFYQEKNPLSLQEKLVRLLDLASGDYINFLMDEDILHPRKMERMLPYLINNNRIKLVTSHSQGIDLNSRVVPAQEITQPIAKQDLVLDTNTMARLMFFNNLNLIIYNYFGNFTAVLFRKKDVTEAFGVFAGHSYKDLALSTWLGLMSQGLGVYLADTLSYNRVHDKEQITSTHMNFKHLVDYAFTLLVAPQYNFIHPFLSEYEIAVQNCLNKIFTFIHIQNGSNQEYKQEFSDIQIDELQWITTKLFEVQNMLFYRTFHRTIANQSTLPEKGFTIANTNPIIERMNHIEEYLQTGFEEANLTPSNNQFIPYIDHELDYRTLDIKLIAFYLPQFQPTAENDRWWGKGFTEWTHVTKAKPQFLGHEQPKLPADLGFYDLRLIDVMKEQVRLAKNYGLSGFCFYYYWFNGKRMLEQPVNQFMKHTEIDFPYCYCWANENWTRSWEGDESNILMQQEYSDQADIDFIEEISKSFSDTRYIKIENKPVLIVYRISLLPDAKATVERWRTYCKNNGVGELFLVAALTDLHDNPAKFGFDAIVEVPPYHLWTKINTINSKLKIVNPHYQGHIFDYKDVVESEAIFKEDDILRFRCSFPAWDNEARRPGKGYTFVNSTPLLYEKWLRVICQETAEKKKPNERLVFVNAWNEWGEGAYLEPDRKYGYAYLQATANVLKEHGPKSDS